MSDQLLTSIFSDVLYVLGSIVLTLIGNLAHKYTIDAKLNGKQTDMNIKKTVIQDIVVAVDRIYHDFDGHDKFIVATEMISKEMRDHGLNMTNEQVKTAIESTVERLRTKMETETEQ